MFETISLSVIAWEILRRFLLWLCRDAQPDTAADTMARILAGGGPRPKVGA